MCLRAQEEARSLQVFLSVAPRDVRAALQYHNRLAHVAYRIGEESRLLRQPGFFWYIRSMLQNVHIKIIVSSQLSSIL